MRELTQEEIFEITEWLNSEQTTEQSNVSEIKKELEKLFAITKIALAITVSKEKIKEWKEVEKHLHQLNDQCLALLKKEPSQPNYAIVDKVLMDVKKRYHNILHGKPTNAFSHTSKKSFSVNPITEEGKAVTDGVQMFIKSFNNIKLNVQTQKVLDALTIKLTKNFPHGTKATADQIQKHRAVELSIDDYMNLCGLKDKKEARKQLKDAIITLFNVVLEWNETHYIVPEGKKRRTKQVLHHKLNIADHIITNESEEIIKNGKAVFKFSFDLAAYLSQACIMPYPEKLLSINANDNRHSYYIGKRLAEHHNMNIDKENANRISVKTLLRALPDLPSYESIMSGNSRSVTQKIIQPFERDLIALKDKYGILASWHYCNSGGEPLTDEQVESYRYDDWVQWLIEFELADYPDQSERLAEKKPKRLPAKRKKTTEDK